MYQKYIIRVFSASSIRRINSRIEDQEFFIDRLKYVYLLDQKMYLFSLKRRKEKNCIKLDVKSGITCNICRQQKTASCQVTNEGISS